MLALLIAFLPAPLLALLHASLLTPQLALLLVGGLLAHKEKKNSLLTEMASLRGAAGEEMSSWQEREGASGGSGDEHGHVHMTGPHCHQWTAALSHWH